MSILVIWLPQIFVAAVLAIACLWYLKPQWLSKLKIPPENLLKNLLIATLTFRLFYPFVLSFAQYNLWSKDPFSQYFLPPHQPLNYFLLYVWGRFWLESVLALAVAGLFWAFLYLIQKNRTGFWTKDDLFLAALLAILTGWPDVIVFLVLVCLYTLLLSLVRLIIFKQTHTQLTSALIIAAIITLLAGDKLINLTGLKVLLI
ncbi:MAG: hypothetical protein A3J48_00980 [Candidatus Doudnabacteria bacterium RIFCSPHIGHO2_02_FULL_46_11]|uniref:Prepilin type IV endopeptidase peptidase domain-containing protein n=1 Tax=Candidatus Doudnabacteria bacterium RIFCSPHIGHO2_02_FULL_46_11 TaxID=1817832 RepID=A0A1F5P7R6_9BACT|nr:MAG: hypothetical protein A3J48_00980 [Candidatus Doudnabacteria bacterium RIFCSPHIGHO2_02_FULL_46_11]